MTAFAPVIRWMVFAAAGVIEVVVAEDQVLDLHRVELQLLHRGDDDVARVILAVHRVEHDVAVVRRDQPGADAGVADPVEVVEQPLPADDQPPGSAPGRVAAWARCWARRPSRGRGSARRRTPCRRSRSRTAARDRRRRSRVALSTYSLAFGDIAAHCSSVGRYVPPRRRRRRPGGRPRPSLRHAPCGARPAPAAGRLSMREPRASPSARRPRVRQEPSSPSDLHPACRAPKSTRLRQRVRDQPRAGNRRRTVCRWRPCRRPRRRRR